MFPWVTLVPEQFSDRPHLHTLIYSYLPECSCAIKAYYLFQLKGYQCVPRSQLLIGENKIIVIDGNVCKNYESKSHCLINWNDLFDQCSQSIVVLLSQITEQFIDNFFLTRLFIHYCEPTSRFQLFTDCSGYW